MSNRRLMYILQALPALIIVGLAGFVFTHLSTGLSVTQGIVMVVIAVIGLLLVMGAIIMLLRTLNSQKNLKK